MFFYEKGGKVKMVTIPIKYKKEEGKFENTEKKNQDCVNISDEVFCLSAPRVGCIEQLMDRKSLSDIKPVSSTPL